MKAKGLIRIALLALVLAMLGVVGWMIRDAVRESRSNLVVFPDGSRLKLLGTGIGNARYTTEKPWHKYARRWLPNRWQGWLPSSLSISSGRDSNGMTIWFTLEDANGAKLTTLPWNWYAAVGDDGFCYPMGGGSGSSSSGGTTVFHVTLDAFPRRQPEFELRFLDSKAQVMASLRLRNPATGPFTEWTPERLPLTRTNGPIVVTLESLTERSNRFSPYSIWIAPKWKIESTDPHWRNAKPAYHTWEDVTGNRGARLSYDERAWKLQLPFRRSNPTNFLADEKFELTDLKVPEAGTFQKLEREFERLGVTFQVRCLAGAGRLFFTNGGDYAMLPSLPAGGISSGTYSYDNVTTEYWTSPKPFFLIECSPPDPLDDLRFRLVGSDQKEIPMTSNGWHGTKGGGRRYQQTFDVTNDISSMSLEVIVSRTRLVEFVIDPAEVRRPNSTNQ